ncbi:hypothetical protein D3C71_1898420 [compost metagenome]
MCGELIEQTLDRLIHPLRQASDLRLAISPDHFLDIDKVIRVVLDILVSRLEVFARDFRPVQRQSRPQFFMPLIDGVGKRSN